MPDTMGNIEPGFSPQQGALCPFVRTPITARLII
jgi:hypothetical protein